MGLHPALPLFVCPVLGELENLSASSRLHIGGTPVCAPKLWPMARAPSECLETGRWEEQREREKAEPNVTGRSKEQDCGVWRKSTPRGGNGGATALVTVT